MPMTDPTDPTNPTPDPTGPPGPSDRPARRVRLSMRRDPGTLGSCGCVDYHAADCPTRTGYHDALSAQEDAAERFLDGDL